MPEDLNWWALPIVILPFAIPAYVWVAWTKWRDCGRWGCDHNSKRWHRHPKEEW